MANVTSLDMQLSAIFSKAAGNVKNDEKRERQIAGLVEQLRRSVLEVYIRGAAASFEEKVEMVCMLRHLDTAHSVLSFVETYSRSPIFRDVDPRRKFGEDGVWLFEQIYRGHHSAYLLKDAIRELHEKLNFVSQGHYSLYNNEGSFFTPEERTKIWEEGTLD